MDRQDLLKTDLNLLISLNVLLEEGNVSRAAERLFITQPAMSKTLSRLRDVFDDPLFTRSSHGMQPTPRALELAEDLATILDSIRQLLAEPEFDPASVRGEVTVAVSEYIGIWILPRLVARLQFLAPNLTLKSITRVEQQLQALAEGSLDFAIHMKHTHYGKDFICFPLGSSKPVILARDGHPLTGERPSWNQLVNYPLIRLYIADQDELEVFQNQRSMARQMAENPLASGGFETSHLLTAMEVLRNTDFLMPGPPFLLDNATVSYKIQALPIPEDIDYDVEYMLVRHQRTTSSALHNWLWDQVIEVLSELRAQVQQSGARAARDSPARRSTPR